MILSLHCLIKKPYRNGLKESDIAKILEIDPAVLIEWRQKKFNLSCDGLGDTAVYSFKSFTLSLLKLSNSPHFKIASESIKDKITHALSHLKKNVYLPVLFFYLLRKKKVRGIRHLTLKEKDWKKKEINEEDERSVFIKNPETQLL